MTISLSSTSISTPRENTSLELARSVEASFLAEMLSLTVLGTDSGGFNGGIGEQQFESFLIREYAELLSEKGSFGLTENIFRSLAKNRSEGNHE